MIAPLDRSLLGEVFADHIALDSRDVMFRGALRRARVAEPTEQRRALAAGFLEDVPDLECRLKLNTNEYPPEPNKDTLSLVEKGVIRSYRVMSVRTEKGDDCYTLMLALRRP